MVNFIPYGRQHNTALPSPRTEFGSPALNDLKIFTFNDAQFTYGTLLTYPGTYFNLQFMSDGSLISVNTIMVVTRSGKSLMKLQLAPKNYLKSEL